MRTLLFIIGFLLVLTPTAHSDLIFKKEEKVLKKLSFSKLISLGSETVTVFEPHEKVNKKYKTVPMKTVLNHIYGNLWKNYSQIQFFCKDGFRPMISVDRFLRHRGFLAYAYPYKKEFQIHKKDVNQVIDLSPYYLIWENIKDSKLQKEIPIAWPYQVLEINLVRD